MNNITVITPYIDNEDIKKLQSYIPTTIKFLTEEDTGRIGSDLMYEKLWTECSPDDIIIMHTDMLPKDTDWIDQISNYVKKYPEAGMFGCKLLYPNTEGLPNKVIQSAGGKFDNNIPNHYGSGLELYSKTAWKDLDFDRGQYDKVREVAWSTFGGIYIRRKVLNEVGNFDRNFKWSYNRDVDYCLSTRKLGWKIYQIPVTIYHFESKDNKIMRQQNPEYNNFEQENFKYLYNKWAGSEFYKTIEIEIND